MGRADENVWITPQQRAVTKVIGCIYCTLCRVVGFGEGQ